MPTPKELHQAIMEQRAELQAALHEVHEKWDVKPASDGDGDAWSPKEVAQHVIGSESFFTNLIVQACGYPASERPQIDVSTPGRAAAMLSRIGVKTDSMLRHVQEHELSKTFEHPRLGTLTVEQMMQTMTSHSKDHTEQLLAAGR